MLTGDQEPVARRIGRELGITDVRARLLPEDKVTVVEALRREHGDIQRSADVGHARSTGVSG